MASVPDYAVAPPPAREDRLETWPRWPLWAPLAAIFFGATTAILIVAVLAGVLRSAGVSIGSGSPAFTSASTFALDVAIVGASVGIAAFTTRPAPWQFSLRRAPFGFSLGIAVLGVVAFFFFEILYGTIFNPKNPQKIVDDLGADRSTLLLVTGALLVILVAPICEELFFRGFLFRVLRVRTSFWVAALIDGILFGLVHGSFVILPILAFLGVVLCWVLERTGTLFATIAIHSLNNAISYGATTDHGWRAAVPVGLAVLAGCVLVPRLLPRRPLPAFAAAAPAVPS